MQKLTRTFLLAVCLVFFMGAGSLSLAETKTVIEPKAENFIFFVDNSGSMGFQYDKLGMTKSKVARDLLLAINNEVPELEANYGVYSYAPYREFLPVADFNRGAIEDAINSIPTNFEIFGRQTPMGSGIMSLDKPVSRLQDRVAVVTVTDGESNLGPHPAGVIRDMYARYGDRICFHFISLAQTADEKALVNELADIAPCSVKADAGDLARNFVRADFIKDVFYDTREIVTAPAPAPAPIITPAEPAPEVEEVIVFSNVTFDFDKAVIKPDYRDILKEAARIIRDRPAKNVIVEGHTCNIGPAEYNMGLSQRRAQAVADFLAGEGVSMDRLETKSYGLTNPKFDNNTREGRSLNRRVEMHLK
jgi:OmpA-OmpF porin, OOP family